MFVATFGTGMAMGMPDVCKTPPFAIPAPFPDIGNNAMCIPGYFTILTAGMPDLNLLSMYAITQGDEAGAMGGVVSQIFIVGPWSRTVECIIHIEWRPLNRAGNAISDALSSNAWRCATRISAPT